MSYTYGEAGHAHAVTALSNGSTYAYDANGNLVQRVISGQTYNLSYDGENWLVEVSGAASASFVYDGDGRRVVATVGGETTVFIGNYFEWQVGTGESRKYYYAGASRIAMWTGSGDLTYLLSDHLGSTSVLADASGTLLSSQGYMPWGETRFGGVGTEYRYTGQYEETDLGLYYYGARWYDPALGRFAQADTLIPDSYDPLDWDRYTYTRNNPLRYADPTGHMVDDGCNTQGCTGNSEATEYRIRIGNFNADKQEFKASPSTEHLNNVRTSQWFWFLLDAMSTIGELIQQATTGENANSSNVFVYLTYSTMPNGDLAIGGVEVTNNSNNTIYISETSFSSEDTNYSSFCVDCPAESSIPKTPNSDWVAKISPSTNKSLPSPNDHPIDYWTTPIFPGSCSVNVNMRMYVPDTLYLWNTIKVYIR